MSIGGLDMRRVITLFAVAVPATLAPVTDQAYAARLADLRLVYQSPQLATDGTGVTWHWTLSNAGTVGADAVIATQRVSAGQRIVAVSAPCTNRPGEVECRLGSLRPGERRTGWIRTAVPPAGGTLRVDGRVTWHEQPGRDLPPIDAGVMPSGPRDAGLAGAETLPAGR